MGDVEISTNPLL